MKRKERKALMPKTGNVSAVIPKHPRLLKKKGENRDKIIKNVTLSYESFSIFACLFYAFVCLFVFCFVFCFVFVGDVEKEQN
jgi:hypothetical protein